MRTLTHQWREGRTTTVDIYGGDGRVILLAHGAGTDRSHPHLTHLAEAIAGAGHTVVTFDYPYRAEGRRPPDRIATLIDCHRSVAAFAGGELGEELVLAGRSMGGRVSTMLAAAGDPCRAVVAYGYPLHPADRPEKLRVEHLGEIPVPTLFVRGSRDSLSRLDLFDLHIRSLPNATVVDVDGADHSFRQARISQEEMARRLATITCDWLDTA